MEGQYGTEKLWTREMRSSRVRVRKRISGRDLEAEEERVIGKEMLVLMQLYEGFNIYYILLYNHKNTHAADTRAAPSTSKELPSSYSRIGTDTNHRRCCEEFRPAQLPT